MEMGGKRHASVALAPGKETPYRLYGRLVGPVWTGSENLAPPGFDPRTVQPVACRYAD